MPATVTTALSPMGAEWHLPNREARKNDDGAPQWDTPSNLFLRAGLCQESLPLIIDVNTGGRESAAS